MLKIPILTLALWSVGSSAYAMTQTVNLSPKAAHTLDLTSQQCTIREAYFGNPRQSEYLEVSLDQPQPRTQKITLRWKDKPSPDPIFLQLHLGGCSLGYALVQIKKSNGTPSSPVTYLGHSEVASRGACHLCRCTKFGIKNLMSESEASKDFRDEYKY